MGFRIHLILKIGTLEIVKNRFRQKKKMKFNFLKENGIFDQKLQFLRFFRILSQSLETHLSYHYDIEMGCFATQNFCQLSYC